MELDIELLQEHQQQHLILTNEENMMLVQGILKFGNGKTSIQTALNKDTKIQKNEPTVYSTPMIKVLLTCTVQSLNGTHLE